MRWAGTCGYVVGAVLLWGTGMEGAKSPSYFDNPTAAYEEIIKLGTECFIDPGLLHDIARYAYVEPRRFKLQDRSDRRKDVNVVLAFVRYYHDQIMNILRENQTKTPHLAPNFADPAQVEFQTRMLNFVDDLQTIQANIDELYIRGKNLRKENPGKTVDLDTSNQAHKNEPTAALFVHRITTDIDRYRMTGEWQNADDYTQCWGAAYEFVKTLGAPNATWGGMTGSARSWGPELVEPIERASGRVFATYHYGDDFSQYLQQEGVAEQLLQSPWVAINDLRTRLIEILRQWKHELPDDLEVYPQGWAQHVQHVTHQLLLAKLSSPR